MAGLPANGFGRLSLGSDFLKNRCRNVLQRKDGCFHMKKKTLLLLMCFVMLASIALAGCTGSPAGQATPAPTSTEDSVDMGLFKANDEYRIFYDGLRDPENVYTDSYRSQELKKRHQEMEETYGITIRYVGMPSYWDSVMESAAAGIPEADVMLAGGPFLLYRFYMHAGIPGSGLQSLSEFPSVKFDDPEYWQTEIHDNITTFGGDLIYAVPNQVGVDSVVLAQITYFNERLVTQAGYETKTLYDWSKNGEWTWERLEEVAVKATDKDAGIFGLMRGENNSTAFSLTASNGGSYISRRDVDGNMIDRYTGMEPKAVEAWEFYIRLNTLGVLGPETKHDQAEFPTGLYAMALTYVNRAPDYNNAMTEDNYGMLMVPKAPGAENYVSDVNWFAPYCAFKNTPNPGGTVQFLNMFFKPIMAFSAPENLALFEQEASNLVRDEGSIETLKATRNVIKTSSFMVYVDSAVGQSIMGKLQQEELLSGSVAPAAYFASLESSINAHIDSMLTARSGK